jgi:hypothetical protein
MPLASRTPKLGPIFMLARDAGSEKEKGKGQKE